MIVTSIEDMPLVELQEFVLNCNSKLMKQFMVKRPPPELAKKISDCFFDIADTFKRQLPDGLKRIALLRLYDVITEHDVDMHAAKN